MKKFLITIISIFIVLIIGLFYYLEGEGSLPDEFLFASDLTAPSGIMLYNSEIDEFHYILQNPRLKPEDEIYTFSFIMPVHNTQDYIMQSVESIIEQDIQNYEIILVENNSTDDSLEICKSLAQKYKQVKLIKQKNGGAGGARNTGLLNARGHYILCPDSDDFYQPNSLSEEEIIDLGEYDVIVFGYNVLRASDDSLVDYKSINLEDNREFNSAHYHTKDFYALDFCYDGFIPGFNKIFRRNFLIKNQLFFPNHIRYEDFYITLRLASQSFKGFAIDKPLYNYRAGRLASLTNSEIKMYDIYYVLEAFENHLLSSGIYEDFERAFALHKFQQIYYRLAKISLVDAYRWLKFIIPYYKKLNFNFEENKSYKIKRVRELHPFFVMIVYVVPKKVEIFIRKSLNRDVFN